MGLRPLKLNVRQSVREKRSGGYTPAVRAIGPERPFFDLSWIVWRLPAAFMLYCFSQCDRL